MSNRFDYTKESKEDLIRYIEDVDFILIKTPLGGYLHNHGDRMPLEQKIRLLKVIGREFDNIIQICPPVQQSILQPKPRCWRCSLRSL